jgi:hypothetical protein
MGVQTYPPGERPNPGYSATETTPKVRVRSETYAAEWISSLRNRIESNCKFGTYRAPATNAIMVQPGDMGYRRYRLHR